MKKVSIIVPIYNVEKTLARCLDSILAQTYKDIELICINDGSTDNSLKIITEYEKLDTRITVKNKKNDGLSNARNDGINLAKGDYIFFLDSDDYIEKNMIEELVKNIEENDMLVCEHYEENNEDIKKVELPKDIKEIYQKEEIKNILIEKYITYVDRNFEKITNIMGSVWKCLFKTCIIKENNICFLKESEPTEDLCFVIKYMLKCNSIKMYKKAFYHYVVNNNSITHGYKEDIIKKLNNATNCIEQIILDNNLIDCYKNNIEFKKFMNIYSSFINECNCPNITIKEKKEKIKNLKKIYKFIM